MVRVLSSDGEIRLDCDGSESQIVYDCVAGFEALGVRLCHDGFNEALLVDLMRAAIDRIESGASDYFRLFPGGDLAEDGGGSKDEKRRKL